MVSHYFQWRWDSFEQVRAAMLDTGRFPMHEVCRPDHLAPIRFGYRLMSQTDPQNRSPSTEFADHVDAHSCIARNSRARRNHDRIRLQPLDTGNVDLVVSTDQDIRAYIV